MEVLMNATFNELLIFILLLLTVSIESRYYFTIDDVVPMWLNNKCIDLTGLPLGIMESLRKRKE